MSSIFVKKSLFHPRTFYFETTWDIAILRFVEKLQNTLSGNIILVVAMPSEDYFVYGSNVLVVVKDAPIEVRSKILAIVREVEKSFGDKIGISPFITTPNDSIIEKFMSAFERPADEWKTAVNKLKIKLTEELDGLLVDFVAAPSESYFVYGSNVLVVVKDAPIEVRSKILAIVREVEKSFGDKIGISPFITTPNDSIIEKFKEILHEGR